MTQTRSDRRPAPERMKFFATGLLILVTAGYLLSRLFESRHPALSVCAAFCEAAMVGAMADWFAVVALFKHPMGVPIPHTAIIPRSKNRIADNLGTFISRNFLGADAILARIRAFGPAARFATWLGKEESAVWLSNHLVRAGRYGLDVIEDQRVHRFIHNVVIAELEKVDFARLGGELLDVVTQNGRHQQLLNELIRQLSGLLENQTTRDNIAEMIAKEFQAWRKGFLGVVKVDEMIGSFAAKKLIGALTRLIKEVESDEAHPLRLKFDQFVFDFIAKLKTDPDFRVKGEQIRAQFLSRPELGAYLRGLWLQVSAWLRSDLDSEKSVIARKVAEFTRGFGIKLQGDRDMQTWINEQIFAAAVPLIEENRAAIGNFIADQVKAWDEGHMVTELEKSIGTDLQFIRINGTVVGGLIGLLIYGSTRLMTG